MAARPVRTKFKVQQRARVLERVLKRVNARIIGIGTGESVKPSRKNPNSRRNAFYLMRGKFDFGQSKCDSLHTRFSLGFVPGVLNTEIYEDVLRVQ